MKFALFLPLLSSLLVFASQTGPATERDISITSRDLGEVRYPETAGGYRARRGGAETNGDLLRRGQKLNKPRKLYESKAKAVHQKRISDSPPLAAAPPAISQTPSGNVYQYRGCFSSNQLAYGSGAEDFSVQIGASTTDIVNACAAKQDQVNKLPGSLAAFCLLDGASYSVNCQTSTSISPGAVPETCTTRNFPVYTLI